MQIDRTENLEHTNFKMFLHTVRMLANSQGFYSRMQRAINEWTDEELSLTNRRGIGKQGFTTAKKNNLDK